MPSFIKPFYPQIHTVNAKHTVLAIAILLALACVSPLSAQTLLVEHPDALNRSTIKLDTQWEFFPGEFISPFDETKEGMLVKVPSNWNSYGLGGVYDKGQGAGSFRLVIQNLHPKTEYAFSIYDLAATSMRIYANGTELITVGKPSLDYTQTVSDQQMGIVSFFTDSKGEVELLFHVSNNFHRSGGIWTSVLVGEYEYIKTWYNRQQNICNLFLGILLVLFFYQFFLFLFRKYDLGCLYLALFALAILTRVCGTPTALVKIYFPLLPYSILLKLEYTALIAGPLFFQLYIDKQVKNIFSKAGVHLVVTVGCILGILVYFFPIYVGCRMVTPCQIYTVATTIYVVASVIKAYVKSRTKTTALILLSLFIIFFSAVHDILDIFHVNIPLANVSIIPYAFLLFAFSQIAIAALEREQAQSSIDRLSETLVQTNKAYYRFVPREFLSLLSKRNIIDVRLGEWITQDMTLLCADIRNFTTISEKIDGKTVFNLLNRYLMRIAPIIRNNHGFIEKYLGDGIIALFPSNGQDAFKCAIEMQQKLAELREELKKENLSRLDIGIGLHFGRIVLGTVGEKTRMNEITLSKAIETVMQLEAVTKDYKLPIVASRTAVEKWNIAEQFSLQILDEKVSLKRGIKETVFSVNADSLEPLP